MKGQKSKIAAFVAREPAQTALSLEERLRRADKAMNADAEPIALEHVSQAAEPLTIGATPTPGTAPTVPATPSLAEAPAVGTTPTVGKSTVEPLEKPTVATTPTVGAAPPVRIMVEPKKGQLRIPNTIVFNLLPQLELGERAVYLELYAWTHGFGEPERRLSIAKLCKSLRIDYKRFMRIVAELVRKGLVEMDERVIGGPRNDRGTLFRIHEPMLLGSGGATPTVGGEPTVGTAPTMKNKKEKHVEKAPDAPAPAPGSVYDVRTRAAKILERRKGEPGFSAGELRAAVSAELAGEGLDVADATIDEAVRGMLP